MNEIKLVKTPWWRMIKVHRKIKRWNKKYGNRPLTMEEVKKAMRDFD